MSELSSEEIAAFQRTVKKLRQLPVDDPIRLKAEQIANSFTREGRHSRRKIRKRDAVESDRTVSEGTATGNPERVDDAPLDIHMHPGRFQKPKRCYSCKESYWHTDGFYHLLCPACADFNFQMRSVRTNLDGRRIVLTGGRVKIGFQLALMFLRDGAELTITTRFPQDAMDRFAAQKDSAVWLNRLSIVGLDFRDPRQVLSFCDDFAERHGSLDILVNNAAQTLRRTADSYQLLVAKERQQVESDRVRYSVGYQPQNVPSLDEAVLDLVGLTDEAGLLPDMSSENSWSRTLGDLPEVEVLETYLVNTFAPVLLCNRFVPLLEKSHAMRRYIVNVSAVEGIFQVRNKTERHPHTNMAKAALNMLTRTSGPGLAKRGIFMSAVDTGWITDENPVLKKRRLANAGFRTPLDIVDGAARVYDPIVRGEAGSPVFGVLLKDYKETRW